MYKRIKESIALLGLTAKDKVTKFVGVVDAISFDLYGCVQISLRSTVNDKEEIGKGYWFDANRLEVQDVDRVMPVPDFDKVGEPEKYKHGPADKAQIRDN